MKINVQKELVKISKLNNLSSDTVFMLTAMVAMFKYLEETNLVGCSWEEVKDKIIYK